MGVSDLVGAGPNLVVTSPDTWEPFKNCEELTPIAGRSGPANGWRITETSSFGSAGEEVTITLDGGSVTELRFGGMSMWPANRWADVEKQLVPGARKAR